MSKKDMVLALIGHYSNGNKAKFAAKIGVTPQTISTWIKRDTLDAERIFALCEFVSAEWLLTGNGSMIKEVILEKNETNADFQIKPLVDLLTHMHTEVGELTSKLSMQISENKILMRENVTLKTKLEKLKDKGPPENKSDRRVHSFDPNIAAEEGVKYGK